MGNISSRLVAVDRDLGTFQVILPPEPFTGESCTPATVGKPLLSNCGLCTRLGDFTQ